MTFEATTYSQYITGLWQPKVIEATHVPSELHNGQDFYKIETKEEGPSGLEPDRCII
jgi:hypothetical protein